jgi:hypothetical protein
VTNPLRLAARLAALLGTSYFLIATSAPYEESARQVCYHTAQSLTLHVMGTCGPEGDVTLTSAEDDCAIAVQGGGAVGLPSAGRFSNTNGNSVSLSLDTWTLSGYLPESATSATVKVDAGVFAVDRDAGVSGDIGGLRDSGSTGGQTTVVSHGNLVERECSNTYNAPLSLRCNDTSGSGCQAVLVQRK